LRDFTAVTFLTFKRRWFIEENGIAVDESCESVALFALYMRVPALQRQLGAFVVIERGRHPTLRIVTTLAESPSVVILKLATVRFFMAGIAILGCALELNFLRADRSFVASATFDCAVSAKERKFCFGMIESVYVRPGIGIVTRLATEGRSAGTFALHSIFELAVMRIRMACRAGYVGKTERQDLISAMRFARGMATRARNGRVSAGKRETWVAMHGDGVKGAVEIHDGVARFAAIVERRLGELIVVYILVAIGAIRKLDLVLRGLAGGNMALGAFDRDMLPLQRILWSRMLFDTKQGRLPGVDGVALGALALLRTTFELTTVNVFVTILAIFEG
jgi:hypothetical protein